MGFSLVLKMLTTCSTCSEMVSAHNAGGSILAGTGETVDVDTAVCASPSRITHTTVASYLVLLGKSLNRLEGKTVKGHCTEETRWGVIQTQTAGTYGIVNLLWL